MNSARDFLFDFCGSVVTTGFLILNLFDFLAYSASLQVRGRNSCGSLLKLVFNLLTLLCINILK